MGDLFHHWIGLGVNGGHVERIVAIADAQESGCLLKSLRPDAGHLFQLDARAEASVLIAESHDVDGGAFGDSGHITQQRPR